MAEKQLKLAMNTNAIWAPSGYGVQARQILPRMAKEGYPTACMAFYGLEGGIINLDGIWFYPKIQSQWGDDAMLEHSKHFKPHIMFTLQDIWTLNPDTFKKLGEMGIKWIPIVPIDHEPVPPAIVERLKLAYRIITYAPFGQRELKGIGLNSTYIPHTVDTKALCAFEAKHKLRESVNIPTDKFVFGMVAANKDNPPRKSFQHVMDAFKVIHDKYPNTMLYFHTLTRQPGGFPIEEYAKLLGYEDAIMRSDPYEMMYVLQPEDMAKIYNVFDCLLLPAQNEGFGVPIIEAGACGVPSIVTDFTAMRDLVIDGKTGFKVGVAERRFSPLGSYVAVPDTNHLIEQMDKMYTMSKTDREKMGKAARKFVKENFDVELVWGKYWVPFLTKLEKEVFGDPLLKESKPEKVQVS